MVAFSVSPVGPFPPATDLGFPDFLQWLLNGVNVGDTSVAFVNLVGAVDATIGTGEETDVLTVNIGAVPAPTPSVVTWRDVPGDTTLVIGDNNNGLSCSQTGTTQTVTIPLDTGDPTVDLPTGASVLIYAAGTATVALAAAGGVTLNVRAAFGASLAGQFAVATLLKRATNLWIACGDLVAV